MWRLLSIALLLLVVSEAAEAQPQPCSNGSPTFNASTDLHKVGGSDMKPNDPSIDSSQRLTTAITYVIGHPECTTLVANPGTYYFYAAEPSPVQPVKTTYIYVPPAKALRIDLRGANLVFRESVYAAFYIYGCQGCEFSNFSIDYENLPFTQLDVQGISSTGINVLPQPGWANQSQLYDHQTKVKGAKRLLFRGFDTRGGVPLYTYTDWQLPPPSSGNPDAITLGSSPDPQSIIQQHDIFIAAMRGGGPAIYEEKSSSTTFNDITIYTSGGPAIESWWSQAMSFIGIRVVPNTGRLVSTVAGGIQLNAMSGAGFVVRNCTVEGTQDDSIAGNAEAISVTASSLTRDSVVTSAPPPQSPVFFLNGTTGAAVGGPYNRHQFNLTGSGNSYSVSPGLTLDQIASLGDGALIYGVNAFGNETGVAVQNNTITNSYLARGIAFSGVSKISITHNNITNTQQAGILIGANLPQNMPTSEILIGDNRLNSINMGMSGVGPTYLGAIQIMAAAANNNVLAGQVSQHVFVNGNTVDGTQRAGIWIGNVHGGAVENNNVSNAGQAGGNLGYNDHLNNGLKDYVAQAFAAGLLTWCTVDVGSSGNTINGPVTSLCPGSTSTK